MLTQTTTASPSTAVAAANAAGAAGTAVAGVGAPAPAPAPAATTAPAAAAAGAGGGGNPPGNVPPSGAAPGGGEGGGGGGGGGGGPGGPGPAGPPPPGPSPVFTSYADLFAALAPTGGPTLIELAGRLGQLNATGRGPIRNTMHALSLRRPTMALLGFQEVANVGLRAYVYVQPLLHTDMPGDAPSGADQATLVQDGDVRFFGNLPMVQVVALGDDVMTRRSVDAPTEAHLATLPNIDVDAGIPPEPAAGANGETVRFRKLGVLPPALAAILLPQSGRLRLSEVQAAVTQYKAAHGVTLEALGLLIRAAMILDGADRPAALTAAEASSLALTQDVMEERLHVVQRDLRLGAQPAGGAVGAGAAVPTTASLSFSPQAATDLGTAVGNAIGASRSVAAAPKTLKEAMAAANLKTLLLFTHQADQADVPALWADLYNAKKSEWPGIVEAGMLDFHTTCFSSGARAYLLRTAALLRQRVVENCPAADRLMLKLDLLAALRQSRTRGNLPRARSRNKLWEIWTQFCLSIGQDELLLEIDDPVPILLAFMCRYRDGRLAAQGKGVLARTVEDVARQIGTTFEELGSHNIRTCMNTVGKIDTRISGIVAHWKQQDPPPNRVKPIPLSIIKATVDMCRAVKSPVYECLADMILIGFFFVCRPGEHTAGSDTCRPFRLADAGLYSGARLLDPDADLDTLSAATFATLTYTNQKNSVPGETIGVGRTGDPRACAIGPIARRLHYLKSNNADPTMPLCGHLVDGKWMVITAAQVTHALRAAVALYGRPYNLTPDQVSARSLRSSGAMAMLCGGVDTARGRLHGRWKSDVMFRYLSVQHAPLCADIAQRMVAGGNFDTIPGAINPRAPGAPTLLPAAATTAAHAAAVAAAMA